MLRRKVVVKLGRRMSTGRLPGRQSSTGGGRQCRPKTVDSFPLCLPRHTATAGASVARAAAPGGQRLRLARPFCQQIDAVDASAQTRSVTCSRH